MSLFILPESYRNSFRVGILGKQAIDDFDCHVTKISKGYDDNGFL
jgi:hypothetical protein